MPDTEQLTERKRYWLKHIQACEANQQSLKAYAREKGLNITSLYYARKQLKRKGVLASASRPQQFVRVAAPVAMSAPASCRVLLVNGTVVEVCCDLEALGKVLEMVAGLG